MKALVLYYSKYGNTRLVAEAIADVLQESSEVRVASLEQLAAVDLGEIDLLVAGCPTHKMNLPETVRPLLEALPRRILRETKTAAFDTSYRMSNFLSRFTAAKKLDHKLRRLGGRRVVAPETLVVAGREGPLEVGELERAQAWTRDIINHLAG